MKPIRRTDAVAAGFDAFFRLVEEAIRDPERTPDHLVVLPFKPNLLSTVFTPERLRIWSQLRRRPPESLTALARRLGRRVSRVREDVILLEHAGLATTRRQGNEVRVTARGPNILIAGPA